MRLASSVVSEEMPPQVSRRNARPNCQNRDTFLPVPSQPVAPPCVIRIPSQEGPLRRQYSVNMSGEMASWDGIRLGVAPADEGVGDRAATGQEAAAPSSCSFLVSNNLVRISLYCSSCAAASSSLASSDYCSMWPLPGRATGATALTSAPTT